MARLKDKYVNEIVPAMEKKFGYKNIMQVPKLEKVVINAGLGDVKDDAKKFDAAVASGDKAQAGAAYTAAVVAVDKAVNKGILHKNNAARKKSSMTLKMNAMA